MSNYPNMSYCQCQNTALALNQVLTAMREDGPLFLQEMGRDERRAFEELFHLCEAFLTASEDLQEQYEEAVREGHIYDSEG